MRENPVLFRVVPIVPSDSCGQGVIPKCSGGTGFSLYLWRLV